MAKPTDRKDGVWTPTKGGMRTPRSRRVQGNNFVKASKRIPLTSKWTGLNSPNQGL